MHILIEDDDLLEKCNTIWEKFSTDIKKEFDNELAYNKHLLKTKIKSHGDELQIFTINKFLWWFPIIFA